MKKVFVVVICVLMSCLLFSCDNIKSGHDSTLNSDFREGSSENISLKEVEFKDIKNKLVGSYSYTSDFALPYLCNYIFLENGDYIIIDVSTKERLTNENSEAQYYMVNDEITVFIKTNNGKTYQYYKMNHTFCESDKMVFAPKIDVIEARNKRLNNVGDYTIDDFETVKIGVSTYYDICKITYINDFIIITPEGDVSEYPTADGKYIRITYDEGLIVKSIEVVDELCEVYF